MPAGPARGKSHSAANTLILGLMSGTSHDGVDSALVRFGSRGLPELICHHYSRYPSGLRRRIGESSGSSPLDIARLDYDIGEFLASAAIKCLKQAGVKSSGVNAIASHGQTIAHIPPSKRRSGATLQIGSPAVIAQRTGIRVVSDFRAADIAAGGNGAPLVPYADRVLFRELAPCSVHNIGGISNLTVIPGGKEDIMAFDTGPGNCLIDTAMHRYFDKPFDRSGRMARSGKPDSGMLRELMAMPISGSDRQNPPGGNFSVRTFSIKY